MKKTDVPFYIHANTFQDDNFKSKHSGTNIFDLVSNPLPESNKKLTGHSARKVTMQKQKDSGLQDTEIVQRARLEQQTNPNSNSVLSINSTTYNSHSTNKTTALIYTCSSSQNALNNGNFNFKNLNPAMNGLFTNVTINGGHFNFSFNTYTGINTNQQSSGIKRKRVQLIDSDSD